MNRIRPRKSAPSYLLHKSTGQARVRIDGKDHYLGTYDSPESREKYQQLLAEVWNPSGKPKPITVKPSAGVTISHLAVEYAKHAKNYYRKKGEPTSEWTAAQRVMTRLRAIYGSTDPAEFGPLRYQAFRQLFIDDGLARTTINKYCWHVRRMFQHAGKNELVPMSLFRDLDSVGNLLEGRSDAKETDDVMPVDDAILTATIKELQPILADMVSLQLLTGMRPGEVRNLRPCDIDRTGDIWIYTPPTHKNEHKKSRKSRTRVVYFGPQSQELVRPYLLRDHQAFCFCPCEADPKRAKEPQYTKDSYVKAISRAALRVSPYPKAIKGNRDEQKQWRRVHCWSPNQLRHNAATLARKHGGLETAQQICGHSDRRTTEKNYAEIDSALAVEFARKFG